MIVSNNMTLATNLLQSID